MVGVLTVDDSPMMRKVIKDIARSNGCEIFEAGSPKEAMDIVREKKPHIILLDIIMEDYYLSGVQALKDIKREFPSTVVIMVTSITNQQDIVKECVQYGADEYISKPFKDEEIRSTIEYYVDRISQMNVVVVDDSEVVRNMLRGIASKAGCKVFEAQNREEAIREVEEKEPDLVFLDIILVDQVSGVAVLKHIKERSPATKVVMVTSIEGQETIVKECVQYGADEFISKPFNEEDILALIHRYHGT